MSPIILSFDGNIGSGKSTIVKYFENNFEEYCNKKNNNYKICFLQEPVKEWEKIVDKESNENIIQKYYKDNEKYAFAFQMMAYISRLNILKKALKKNYDIIITERSIYTDRNVFAKMLFSDKKINDVEWQIYNLWFDEFDDIVKDIKTVYIRTSPKICQNRIIKRNRLGEDISYEYLKNCHAYHEYWLNDIEEIKKSKILIVNGNEETITSLFINNTYYDDLMYYVYNFIKN
tara:strand:- start:751 stop:1446 length:696 start_codon:yes stop_codon:yes gene_type:complete